ncbi:MAG TPA: BA14K family protein [Devosia sp.]|nr:BA14K family protein [Devosia sp.]
MKKLLALAATALVSVALALPAATPAAAQGFSFGWSVGPGYMGYNQNYRPWGYYGGPRVRSGISIGVGGVRVRGSSSWSYHVARCEARYRSYDSRSDTYLGFDGNYHRCRL